MDKLIKSISVDRSFLGYHDAAMISVLWSTGMRRPDLARLNVNDIRDKSHEVLIRKSKNGKGRTASLLLETEVLLKRYLAIRAKHPFKDDPALWLSQRAHTNSRGVQSAGLQPDAISNILQKRCRTADVKLPSHSLRRGFASDAKNLGISDSTIMTVCGWSSVTTLRRYTKQHESAQAIKEMLRLRR